MIVKSQSQKQRRFTYIYITAGSQLGLPRSTGFYQVKFLTDFFQPGPISVPNRPAGRVANICQLIQTYKEKKDKTPCFEFSAAMGEVSSFPVSLSDKCSLKPVDKTLAVTHRLLPLNLRLPATSSVNLNVRLSISSSSSRGCTLKCSASTPGT